MALKGMGTDIAEIARLSKIIDRYGDKFLCKVYTADEIELCVRPGGGYAASRLAGRWAAKEAFYKALPDALQRLSSWKSIKILSSPSGRPYIEVCDKRLSEALFVAGITSLHLSISHERTHCVAMVILE